MIRRFDSYAVPAAPEPDVTVRGLVGLFLTFAAVPALLWALTEPVGAAVVGGLAVSAVVARRRR